MRRKSFKKRFPEIGEVEYKIASTREELEGALALVYREYLVRGYILSKYYKSGLRLVLQNIVPGTTVFIGLKDKEVIAATTLIPDSPLGLPLDQAYKEEADELRKSGRKICEVGQMAIKSELFGRRFFSMFNFKKLEFLFTLFKLAFQYALYQEGFDDMCIVTNPKFMIFKFLPFEVRGDVKYYGYDRVAVKKKAAVLKVMDLKAMRSRFKKFSGNARYKLPYKLVLYKMFVGTKIPRELFEEKMRFTVDDIRYFFVEKSDILKRAKKDQKKYICSSYNLDYERFNNICLKKKD